MLIIGVKFEVKLHKTSIFRIKSGMCKIRVITKLPNSEQSYKGKVKTHQYIKSVNNQKTVKTVMTLTWYRHFETNGG